MQLIKQSKLFFKEGNSDKVYEIDLCALTENEYLVNFRYGRRGAALKEGTKTPAALSLDAATQIFNQLEKEKIDKGYRSEIQIKVELPIESSFDKNTKEGKILQRLDDAVKGTKSFKTEWKTSRVIWKAGQLQLQAAVPYIINLANKGDYFQLHASLWALVKMQSATALPLFMAFATDNRQGENIRNLALYGWLTLSQNADQQKAIQTLATDFSPELKDILRLEDSVALEKYLSACSAAKDVKPFVALYILSKVYHFLTPTLLKQIKSWSVAPPFFKTIRAVYKLSQLSDDAAFNGLMAYKMEQAPAMFKRTHSLDAKYKFYNKEIGERIVLGDELRSANSRLGFSQFTKAYFQKNALQHLKDLGVQSDPKLYLKFAVATLLQYDESDYVPAEEKPFRDYGSYNYRERLYYFELYDYPESPKALLLNSILFGADKSRKLSNQLSVYKGKRIVKSQRYYYQADQVQNVAATKQTPDAPQKEAGAESLLDTALNTFKSWFGKKKEIPTPEPPKQEIVETKVEMGSVQNSVLFPEHWNAVPEAYVQLLMQSKMNMILEFAYNNLKQHKDYDSLKSKLDNNSIIFLLQSDFVVQQKMGWELLRERSATLGSDMEFVAQVLNSNSNEAVLWAQQMCVQNRYVFFENIDFIVALIFNTKAINTDWISRQFETLNLNSDKSKAILGKAVVQLLQIEIVSENEASIPLAIARLNTLAASHYAEVSWDIVEQLMQSKTEANKILAGEILKVKVKQHNAAAVPLSLLNSFLNSELIEVRGIGTDILKQFSVADLSKQLNELLPFTQSIYLDVLEVVLQQLKAIAVHNTNDGEMLTRHLLYELIRREKVEGAHSKFMLLMRNELKPFWNKALRPKDITKLVHAQYRESQLMGLEILKSYSAVETFSLGQLISFASNELLEVRQFVWQYYEQNLTRIKAEREKALSILDAKWDDSRHFGFEFFKKHFESNEWDADTLVAIVDSIRPDVEQFGKEMITLHFKPEFANVYLEKLCEHPSVYVQNFVSTYLSVYAKDNTEMLSQLMYYFRSVLSRVNKARVAKDRIYNFLRQEGLKEEANAKMIVPLLNDLSAQQGIQDKATCIAALTAIKNKFPDLQTQIILNEQL